MARKSLIIENLGKRYDLVHRTDGYVTLTETLWHSFMNPGRTLRDLLARKSAGDGREFWALREVSFEVNESEVIGVVGHNGAGKSTLLKIISNVLEPSTGQCTVFGRVGSLLEVGMGFHPELTGRENVYLSGVIIGMKRWEIAEKLQRIIDFSGIGQFIDVPVKRYSSGMYVRLAFSVAAHLDSEIMIVDEALSVGDSEFQVKCRDKMRDVIREGRTILFVTHSMEWVTNFCTRALLVHSGRLIADGAPNEIVAEYEKSVAAGQSDAGNGSSGSEVQIQ